MAHVYSYDQYQYIKNNAKGITTIELTKKFNEHFNTDLNKNQIRAYMKNHGIRNGLDTKLKKGNVPWNKGKKGVNTGGEVGWFKKGNKPYNWVPIGTERINCDGYVDIKIQDGHRNKNWRGKHIVLWEKYHNKSIPKDGVVIFGDGNRRNFDIENLILITREQLLIMNRKKLIMDDADLTKTGLVIAKIYEKIYQNKED